MHTPDNCLHQLPLPGTISNLRQIEITNFHNKNNTISNNVYAQTQRSPPSAFTIISLRLLPSPVYRSLLQATTIAGAWQRVSAIHLHHHDHHRNIAPWWRDHRTKCVCKQAIKTKRIYRMITTPPSSVGSGATDAVQYHDSWGDETPPSFIWGKDRRRSFRCRRRRPHRFVGSFARHVVGSFHQLRHLHWLLDCVFSVSVQRASTLQSEFERRSRTAGGGIRRVVPFERAKKVRTYPPIGGGCEF